MSRKPKPTIIGGGIAGLATALCLAPHPVRLVVRTPLGTDGSSLWAQGGIAAAVGADDEPRLHAEDTIRAGAGLCDPAVVREITQEGPWAIEQLASWGVPFDRDAQGRLDLGLEGGHGRRRIVHARGDATGQSLMETLVRRVLAEPAIERIEGAQAVGLLEDEAGLSGVVCERPGGSDCFPARAIVLATGGVGGLFEQTTNPLSARGQGLLLALEAGAELVDLEFIQYHPTALATGQHPLPLISEAVRGEGACLVDEAGERFAADLPGAELAPRDRVARAIWQHQKAGHRIFLDARRHPGDAFAIRFPKIDAICRAHGLDPARDLLPVTPAVHYHMGGIAVDREGRSSRPGLWAVGETASTGLHGANRLASNSLLEAVVCARAVAASIAASPLPPLRHETGPRTGSAPTWGRLPGILARSLGVIRNRESLESGLEEIRAVVEERSSGATEARLAWLWIRAALWREESRGSHYRSDWPEPREHGFGHLRQDRTHGFLKVERAPATRGGAAGDGQDARSLSAD